MRKIDVTRSRQRTQRKNKKEQRKRKRERQLFQVLRSIRRRIRGKCGDLTRSRLRREVLETGATRRQITDADLDRLFWHRDYGRYYFPF